MMKLRFASVCIPLIVACGPGGSGNDAGTDSSVDKDASSGSDSSSDSSSNKDSTPLGDAGGLVGQCQAAANNFATLCAGDDQRPCLWAGYANLCAVGNTQLLIDSMKCLDNTTCRTFSDPNEGLACLGALHAAEDSAKAKAYLQSNCTACGGSNCSTDTGDQEIISYLTDADIDALQSCAGTACLDFPSFASCTSNPDLAPFYCH